DRSKSIFHALLARRDTPLFYIPSPTTHLSSFFFQCSADHRDLHSFPTRRSSDLMVVDDQDPHAHFSGTSTASVVPLPGLDSTWRDRKSTRLISSHRTISYAVFCLKKKKKKIRLKSTI